MGGDSDMSSNQQPARKSLRTREKSALVTRGAPGLILDGCPDGSRATCSWIWFVRAVIGEVRTEQGIVCGSLVPLHLCPIRTLVLIISNESISYL